ncbi:MAG: hypothetical protein ACR2PX_23975 [Endozoicomonas sp.]|uniref:hypothetical protein n=1 Tax=Endozoicomonas sp. TaxID=1892382 RepID=UPI003D9BEB29
MKLQRKLNLFIFLTLFVLNSFQKLPASPDIPITPQEQKVADAVSDRILRHIHSTLETTLTGAEYGATVGVSFGTMIPLSIGFLHGIHDGPYDVASEAKDYGVIAALSCCIFVTLGTGIGGGIGMAYGVIRMITEEGLRFFPIQLLGGSQPATPNDIRSPDEL